MPGTLLVPGFFLCGIAHSFYASARLMDVTLKLTPLILMSLLAGPEAVSDNVAAKPQGFPVYDWNLALDTTVVPGIRISACPFLGPIQPYTNGCPNKTASCLPVLSCV